MIMTKIETEGYHGRNEISLEARFLKEGRVFLLGDITTESALEVMQKLIYLENDPGTERVKLYINSPGGGINSGLLIYDVLESMTKPVDMYCIGMAASMAAVVLAAGKKGHRHILPHSKVMIHEPRMYGGEYTTATDMKNMTESIMKTKEMVNKILAKQTGKTLEEINEATAYDNYMDAEESVAFGLCDDISSDIY